MAFGKRKPLINARGKPLPNWQRISLERQRQARVRRAGDEMKRIAFQMNPRARIWSCYGMTIVNGRKQKFSFDVLYDPRDYSNMEIYQIKKRTYEKLYQGELPRNYYYIFFLDPMHLIGGRWIRHEGIIEIAQISKGKGVRGKFDKWRPGGSKIEEETS